jgi:queuine tRNA-ribosyltransferase
LASLQNLRFYLWLVQQARKHILEGQFHLWKASVLPSLNRRL